MIVVGNDETATELARRFERFGIGLHAAADGADDHILVWRRTGEVLLSAPDGMELPLASLVPVIERFESSGLVASPGPEPRWHLADHQPAPAA